MRQSPLDKRIALRCKGFPAPAMAFPVIDDFWLSLLMKMTASAMIVVTASILVERMGPLMGSLLATLPLSAGPNFAYLAIEHGPAFLAETARVGLQVNIGTAPFVLVYAFVAIRQNVFVSIVAGYLAWGATLFVVRSLDPGIPATILANVAVYGLCIVFGRRFLSGPLAVAAIRRWWDLPLRAATVMGLVAAVVISGRLLGPAVTGVVAILPVVYSSLALILHPRIGGAATARVLVTGYPGLLGFGAAVATVSVTAIPFGSALSLTAGLCVAVIWNAILLLLSRRPSRRKRIGEPA
jgi:hypothetical protein